MVYRAHLTQGKKKMEHTNLKNKVAWWSRAAYCAEGQTEREIPDPFAEEASQTVICWDQNLFPSPSSLLPPYLKQLPQARCLRPCQVNLHYQSLCYH